MTRVRIALISKPEMNFTETADLLMDCLADEHVDATCTQVPKKWEVVVDTLDEKGLLEWCRISTFSSRYISGIQIVPEKSGSGVHDYRSVAVEVTKQIMEEVMTYQPTYYLLPDLIADIVARALRDQAHAINNQHLDTQLAQARESARATLSFALAYADQQSSKIVEEK